MLGHVGPAGWGNPSLCPAFRVRRGNDRENGFVSGRARRATRPTPSEFRCHVGMAPTSTAERRCRGASSSSASPCALPTSPSLARSSWGTRSESGGDPDGIDSRGRGAQGPTESSGRRARGHGQCHPARSRPQRCWRQPVARSWTIKRKQCREDWALDRYIPNLVASIIPAHRFA